MLLIIVWNVLELLVVMTTTNQYSQLSGIVHTRDESLQDELRVV